MCTFSKNVRILFAAFAFVIGSLPVISFAQTGCTVSWTPINDPNLSGHIIYAGTAPKRYRVFVKVGPAVTSINCDNAAFTSLPKPATWCFTVTSINISGRETIFTDLAHVCTAEAIEP